MTQITKTDVKIAEQACRQAHGQWEAVTLAASSVRASQKATHGKLQQFAGQELARRESDFMSVKAKFLAQ